MGFSVFPKQLLESAFFNFVLPIEVWQSAAARGGLVLCLLQRDPLDHPLFPCLRSIVECGVIMAMGQQRKTLQNDMLWSIFPFPRVF